MIRVEKLTRSESVFDKNPALPTMLEDFVRRSDPYSENGYSAGDIARILVECADHPVDAAWLAHDDEGRLCGFCIVCVGLGIAHGTREGHVIALYVEPGTVLSAHREIAAAVKEWAQKSGLRRVVGGSQNDTVSWERAGYKKVATLYSMELGG